MNVLRKSSQLSSNRIASLCKLRRKLPPESTFPVATMEQNRYSSCCKTHLAVLLGWRSGHCGHGAIHQRLKLFRPGRVELRVEVAHVRLSAADDEGSTDDAGQLARNVLPRRLAAAWTLVGTIVRAAVCLCVAVLHQLNSGDMLVTTFRPHHKTSL